MRILSRSLALVFAVMLVGVGAWFMLASPERTAFVTRSGCEWLRQKRPADASLCGQYYGWTRHVASAFSLYLPPGWTLRPIKDDRAIDLEIGAPDGVLYLLYAEDRDDLLVLAMGGQNTIQRNVQIGGRCVKLVQSDLPNLPGVPGPYPIAVYMPEVSKEGLRRMGFNAFGFFHSEASRALAYQTIMSLKFVQRPPWPGDAPVVTEMTPSSPKALPPTFDIAPTTP